MISLVDNVINLNKLKCSPAIGVVTAILGSKRIAEVIVKDLLEGACSDPSTPGPEEHEKVIIPTDRRETDLKRNRSQNFEKGCQNCRNPDQCLSGQCWARNANCYACGT